MDKVLQYVQNAERQCGVACVAIYNSMEYKEAVRLSATVADAWTEGQQYAASLERLARTERITY